MLTPTQILKSDIVANSTMNRSRGLSGVNSYTKDLRFDVLDWLLKRRQDKGSVVWYDVCCGEGRALFQTVDAFSERGLGDTITIFGADLVQSSRSERTNVTLIEGDVNTLAPVPAADLITCVHGLHYIGDKLGLLSHLSGLLTDGGLFIANIDPANIRFGDAGPTTWRAVSSAAGPDKNRLVYKDHILQMHGPKIAFNAKYQGASASERPNYTGITVMDSWYSKGST